MFPFCWFFLTLIILSYIRGKGEILPATKPETTQESTKKHIFFFHDTLMSHGGGRTSVWRELETATERVVRRTVIVRTALCVRVTVYYFRMSHFQDLGNSALKRAWSHAVTTSNIYCTKRKKLLNWGSTTHSAAVAPLHQLRVSGGIFLLFFSPTRQPLCMLSPQL